MNSKLIDYAKKLGIVVNFNSPLYIACYNMNIRTIRMNRKKCLDMKKCYIEFIGIDDDIIIDTIFCHELGHVLQTDKLSSNEKKDFIQHYKTNALEIEEDANEKAEIIAIKLGIKINRDVLWASTNQTRNRLNAA